MGEWSYYFCSSSGGGGATLLALGWPLCDQQGKRDKERRDNVSRTPGDRRHQSRSKRCFEKGKDVARS